MGINLIKTPNATAASNRKRNQKTSNTSNNQPSATNNKPIPTVSLEAFPDTMGGYNIQIKTTNYTFTPKEAGKENTPNTGHAHVYVNEVKVGRAYGEWYNIPKSFFHTGMNTISVSLNGNDHSVWVLNDGKTEVAAAEMVEVK
jgi:hypothetical protein